MLSFFAASGAAESSVRPTWSRPRGVDAHLSHNECPRQLTVPAERSLAATLHQSEKIRIRASKIANMIDSVDAVERQMRNSGELNSHATALPFATASRVEALATPSG